MKFKEQNLPNKLTTIRMFLVPVMILLFVLYILKVNVIFCENMEKQISISLLQILMFVVFVGASITDALDGKIARKNNLVTEYGKLMDPLADKLLVNSTLILLIPANMYFQRSEKVFFVLGIIAMFLAIITIARDFFVDALRSLALKNGVVVPASIFGKIKTATLMPGIACLLLGSFFVAIYVIGIVLVIIGGVFAIIGGFKYYQAIKPYLDK